MHAVQLRSQHTNGNGRLKKVAPLPTTKFRLEQRVMRQAVVGDKGQGFFHGRIVAIRERPGLPELYDVSWDHSTTDIDTGYLPQGLQADIAYEF